MSSQFTYVLIADDHEGRPFSDRTRNRASGGCGEVRSFAPWDRQGSGENHFFSKQFAVRISGSGEFGALRINRFLYPFELIMNAESRVRDRTQKHLPGCPRVLSRVVMPELDIKERRNVGESVPRLRELRPRAPDNSSCVQP